MANTHSRVLSRQFYNEYNCSVKFQYVESPTPTVFAIICFYNDEGDKKLVLFREERPTVAEAEIMVARSIAKVVETPGRYHAVLPGDITRQELHNGLPVFDAMYDTVREMRIYPTVAACMDRVQYWGISGANIGAWVEHILICDDDDLEELEHIPSLL